MVCSMLPAVSCWSLASLWSATSGSHDCPGSITWYQTWQPTALPSASMVVRELPATLGTLGTAPAQEENQLVQRRALSRTPGPPGAAPFSPPYPSWGGGDPAAPRHSPSLASEVLLSSTSARTQPEPAPTLPGLEAQDHTQPASIQHFPCTQRLNHQPTRPEHTHKPQTHLPFAHRMSTGKIVAKRRKEEPRPALPLWGKSLFAASKEAC